MRNNILRRIGTAMAAIGPLLTGLTTSLAAADAVSTVETVSTVATEAGRQENLAARPNSRTTFKYTAAISTLVNATAYRKAKSDSDREKKGGEDKR